MDKVRQVIRALHQQANEDDRTTMMRFFKTGVGQYGAHDKFIGVRVPKVRTIAKEWLDLTIPNCEELLLSPIHEERMLALLIWVYQFQTRDETKRATIYHSYLKYAEHVNNWDLVDLSAHYIVGCYLYTRPRQELEKLASSDNLWKRRIALVATLYFIRKQEYQDTLRLVTKLLTDQEDLIHKASGWMLREVMKRDEKTAFDYLKLHYLKMPRTTLRYAIERFDKPTREAFLQGRVCC